MALSIIKEDDVIYERTFGLRDVEAGLELTPDTRFPVASITKSFTAMSVALLVDEGKLESTRVEFSRSQDSVTDMTLKATFMTLEAPRVK